MMYDQRRFVTCVVVGLLLCLAVCECRRIEGKQLRRHRNRGLLRFPGNESTTTRPTRSTNPIFRPFGATKSSRKQNSAIRGSRKAVVVTKKTYLRKEWCKTQPLKQIIREKGCLRTTVINSFCYGQCNSFFIPKSDKSDDKPTAFMSCGFCKPRKYRWILVTLRCPGKKGMRFKRKRIMRIKKCRCMAQDVQFP
ncbi:gremlin-2 [Patella vulgata]|uniref:gremlin-2 n=1 Tax=Patella vulgata TaxID=6465 RepID=UPI00217FB911|nr:gremlin-2 [Patella vulgata]